MSAALICAGGLWMLLGMWPTFHLATQRGSFMPLVVWAAVGAALMLGGVAV